MIDKLANRILLVGLVVLLLIVGLRSCKESEVARVKNIALAPNETAKVVIETGAVGEARRAVSGVVRVKRSYVPPEGRTEVVVKTGGEVEVRSKVKGFCFRPGMGIALVDGDKTVGILDIKFAYFGRLGLVAGFGLKKGYISPPYIGSSWTIYSNSALFVGVNLKHQYVLGLRLTF